MIFEAGVLTKALAGFMGRNFLFSSLELTAREIFG